MRFREWLHPHVSLLLALVAVAIVSAGALGWLGWLLIQQDASLARHRESDRLQQRAETAAAALRASLADLPRLAAAGSSSPQDGVLRAELAARGVVLRGGSRVLWVPNEGDVVGASSADLAPWHPGRCAELSVDGEVVGHAGEVHPSVCQAFGLPKRTVAAEVDLDVLIERAVHLRPAPAFFQAS